MTRLMAKSFSNKWKTSASCGISPLLSHHNHHHAVESHYSPITNNNKNLRCHHDYSTHHHAHQASGAYFPSASFSCNSSSLCYAISSESHYSPKTIITTQGPNHKYYSTISIKNKPQPNGSKPKGRKSYSVVLIDVETTGRSPTEHHVLELAAIKLRDGVTVGQFGTLISHPPHVSIPQELTAVHGITNRMMEKGIPLKVALELLNSFAGDGSVLMAHNASFDRKFLQEAFHTEQMVPTYQHDNFLCTLNLSRRLLDLESHTLEAIADHLGMALPKSSSFHRAMSDTRCTAMIWKHLYQKSAQMLGFYPELDFFHGLSKVAKKNVPSYVKRYKKSHSQEEQQEIEEAEKVEKRPRGDPYAEIPFLRSDYRFSTAHLEEDPSVEWNRVREVREQQL